MLLFYVSFFMFFIVYLEETIFHWVYDGFDPRLSSKMSIRRNHLPFRSPACAQTNKAIGSQHDPHAHHQRSSEIT